ncbi:LppX_LprAFG lipoprotein [Actinomadura sp. 3N407]|uniref:LppX_LprAFG lipoprotein n=1 Tax=Actinomadura sp. 3N407 TaxID=3457423 RepID=UPI003FCED412
MIRRFATGVALATGLALSLTGCLGEAGDKVDEAGKNLKLSAAQVLGKTAENTGQIDSFKADLSMRMTGSKDGDVTMDGEMQYRMKPDLAYRMHFGQMSVAGREMGGGEQILLGGHIYIKLPSVAGGGTSGKPWIKMSVDEIGKKTGISFDKLLQQSQQMDPVQNTKLLTASKDVREVGKENVDGVETTHYTGTYRVEDAVAKLPPESQEMYRKGAALSGMGNMHFDLWVDDRQLPRKMAMKSQQTADGAMNMTIKYRDFGKPVQITAPPESQVTDFSEMLNALGGGS